MDKNNGVWDKIGFLIWFTILVDFFTFLWMVITEKENVQEEHRAVFKAVATVVASVTIITLIALYL